MTHDIERLTVAAAVAEAALLAAYDELWKANTYRTMHDAEVRVDRMRGHVERAHAKLEVARLAAAQ